MPRSARIKASHVLGLWAAALCAACVAEPPPPPPTPPPVSTGPVTSIAVARDGSVLHCRTRVVRWNTVEYQTRNSRVIAAVARPFGGFVLVGGQPGREGWLRELTITGAFGPPVVVANDVVECVAITPTARLEDEAVAAGGADGRVWLWQPPGESVPIAMARHTGPCRAVAFQPGRDALLSGGRDGRLLMISLDGSEVRELLDHTAGVECIATADDGRFASGALDGRVRLHDADGALRRTWQRIGGAPAALLRCDDGWLAGLTSGDVVYLSPRSEQARVVHRMNQPIHAMARNGDRLLLGLQDGLAERSWPVN